MTHGHRSAARGHPTAQPQGRCNIRGKGIVAPQQQVETAHERPERHGPIARKKQYLRFYHVCKGTKNNSKNCIFEEINTISHLPTNTHHLTPNT